MVAPPQSVHYAITNLDSGFGPEPVDAPQARTHRLQEDLAWWQATGVDVVQLREKRIAGADLFALAAAAATWLRAQPGIAIPKLLINSRTDIAVAARADGVHLTSQPGELRPHQVREIFRRACLPSCTVSVSCHTLAEVAERRSQGADLILFGPVFGKLLPGGAVAPGSGLSQLRQACAAAAPVPVLALGGITGADECACLQVGAAGVAGIRLFASRTVFPEPALPKSPPFA